MINLLRGAALLVLSGFSLPGALITVAPFDGTTTVFPEGGTCFVGPSAGTVAGFAVSADGNACYPYGGAANNWTLGNNGTWSIGLIGDNSPDGSSTITIDLAGLYSSVGGFVNYYTPLGAAGAGSVNDGAFRGIERATADIAYLRFGGSGMVMHDITVAAVPEPSTLALAGFALLGIGLLRRRRR